MLSEMAVFPLKNLLSVQISSFQEDPQTSITAHYAEGSRASYPNSSMDWRVPKDPLVLKSKKFLFSDHITSWSTFLIRLWVLPPPKLPGALVECPIHKIGGLISAPVPVATSC